MWQPFGGSKEEYLDGMLRSLGAPVAVPEIAALTVFQRLEVHDPFNTPSQWTEAGYIGCTLVSTLLIPALVSVVGAGMAKGYP